MLLIPFIMVFTLLRVSPMMYDGWAGPYYYEYNGGLLTWGWYVLFLMRDWINGRVASNFVCGILESFKSEIPLDLAGALVITGMLYCLYRLFPGKNKITAALVFGTLVILMPYRVRTYVLQIATIAYLPPLLFVLVMLLALRNWPEKGSGLRAALLALLSVAACTWMENSSVAYGVVLALCSLEQMLRMRKFDWRLCLVVLVALAAGLFMITSPGTLMSRATGMGADSFLMRSTWQYYQHIHRIFLDFICYGGMANLAMALAASGAALVSIFNSRDKRLLVLRVLVLLANLVAVAFFFWTCYETREFQYTAPLITAYCEAVAVSKPLFVTLFVFVYLLWVPVNALVLCKPDKHTFYLTVYTLVSTLIVFLTNQFGSRIYSPLYVIQVFLLCVILLQTPLEVSLKTAISKGWALVQVGELAAEKREKDRRNLQPKRFVTSICLLAIVFVFILALDYELQLCSRITSVETQRQECVEEIRRLQIAGVDDDTYYRIPLFNERDIYLRGETSIGTFHYPQFLQRHGLMPDTKLVFTNETVYLSVDDADERGVAIRVVNRDDAIYSYDFTVNYKKELTDTYENILVETGILEDTYFVPASRGDGYYQIGVTLTNVDSGIGRALTQTIEHRVYSMKG